ncbi:MAG: phospho-sugar mutase, partial [Acidimicrobiia bacterium]
MDVHNRALEWIAGDPDPTTRDELQALIDAGNDAALGERMAGPLQFGTAGIRGVVEAGDARMNRATVIRATAGLATSLTERFGEGLVVVGFDARLSSEQFARDTIGVLLAAGFSVRFFLEPTPTPVVAYAGKVYDAVATVIVTASHNPPRD